VRICIVNYRSDCEYILEQLVELVSEKEVAKLAKIFQIVIGLLQKSDIKSNFYKEVLFARIDNLEYLSFILNPAKLL